jgi:hypothetical protein
MRDPDVVIRQISAAFASVPLPEPALLHNPHCCECEETSNASGGRPWTAIALEDVLRGREVALLSAAAWRYYLPALMIWCIRAPEAVDVLQDNLVHQLEPPDDGRGVPEWFAQRAPGFSPAQREAIVAYLEWYREREEQHWPAGTVPRRGQILFLATTSPTGDGPTRSAGCRAFARRTHRLITDGCRFTMAAMAARV